MFIYRYFIGSLKSITSLYALRDERLWKVIVYFLLITLIFSFPANFYVIQSNGEQLTKLSLTGSITEDYVNQLPSDCVIGTTITCTESINYEVQAGKLIFVFNAEQDYPSKDNTLVFYKDQIVFNSNGDNMSSNYNFEETLQFNELKTLPVNEVTEKLIGGFKGNFSTPAILFSITFYTFSNLLMNSLFILIASLIALLLRFGMKKAMTYMQALKLFVFSSTLPILICVILGMFGLYPFMAVIYQFGTPLMFLLVFYRNINQVN